MTVLDDIFLEKPIIVIGGAVCDMILSLPNLPKKGSDIEAFVEDKQVGGCGFNVARALSRLGENVICGIAIGNGPNGKLVADKMKEENLEFFLFNQEKDNGWCMALVEPDGERTFISITGCEGDWESEMLCRIPVPEPSFVYANGYEIASKNAVDLREWLFELPPKVTRFIDLGPRITEVDLNYLKRLFLTPCILSLNQSEIEYLCGKGDLPEQASNYAKINKIDVLCRLGENGTYICYKDGNSEFVKPYSVPNIIDTVGAGDLHCSGTLAGLSSGWTLVDAVDLGNKTAAYSICGHGPEYAPNWQELNSFLKKKE